MIYSPPSYQVDMTFFFQTNTCLRIRLKEPQIRVAHFKQMHFHDR